MLDGIGGGVASRHKRPQPYRLYRASLHNGVSLRIHVVRLWFAKHALCKSGGRGSWGGTWAMQPNRKLRGEGQAFQSNLSATGVGMGWAPEKRHVPGGNVLDCDMNVKKYFAFCGRKYVAFWRIERRWAGDHLVLSCIRRHKCRGKGNLEGIWTLRSWRTRRGGREGPLGRGPQGLLGNSSLLRSEKLISY